MRCEEKSGLVRERMEEREGKRRERMLLKQVKLVLFCMHLHFAIIQLYSPPHPLTNKLALTLPLTIKLTLNHSPTNK